MTSVRISGSHPSQHPESVGVEEIRSHFPALDRTHLGLPVAYFDGPGGTQVPREVARAMTDYLFHHNANTHWAYPTSIETDAILESARDTLADFLNATPQEIAFGQNMTTLTFHLARALGREWKRGDEIIVTELEHHANVAPWRALEKDRGVTVRMARADEKAGTVDLDDLARLIGPRTRLIAIGAASNALGTVTDVARVCAMAREAGALSFVDAVHYAPHLLVDVRNFGCDFLACSAYKFYGPHVGILYGRRDRIEALDVPRLEPAPDYAPERLETGTQSHESIAGAAAAVEFLSMLATGGTRRTRLERAFASIHQRKRALFARLWEGLGAIDGVTRYGPAAQAARTPTAAFTVRGMDAEHVARALAERGVFASHGDFYAATIVAKLGLADAGLVRAGCAIYTTPDEIDRLLEGVTALAR
ncbi:MAG TPA: cysteine desulfurase-like protein [Gemmatimonadaceae bacterium]|nr:cysteine desulfurase-like protein [Gemmatimonadaceae bacterium]